MFAHDSSRADVTFRFSAYNQNKREKSEYIDTVANTFPRQYCCALLK